MTLFVMMVQICGLFLVFLIFPIYVLPYFKERFEPRLPNKLPNMQERILFHRYGPAVESVVDHLARQRTPFVILEQDAAVARRLADRGFPVVVGQLDEDPGLLEGLIAARALVTNANDHVNATFIMMAREQGFTGPIYAMAENPLHRPPMLTVGATEFGAVGRKIVEILKDARETTVVIDELDQPGVDVVGNLLQQSTLEQARVREAGTVVLALSDDSSGVFGTAIVRDYAPQVRLIARVNRASNVPRLYQVGADFALSVGQVAGQLLAHQRLGDGSLRIEQRLRCARMRPGTLVGGHPWRSGVREQTGASIIALEHNGQMMIEFDETLRIDPADLVYVCGTASSIESFMRAFRAEVWEGPRGG
ncbi:NAD-binding protein [Thiocystis violacea]|uniref:NAD-binding protein n=1 Tax=Thiocystis violacea TaxID=13725 RepID=UPI0019081370|nr:NAD-binding protein [Thiocystis violacea]MBK1722289.1 hypothetical protein [Thiocystis violacea]